MASIIVAAGFLFSKFPAGVSNLPNSPLISAISILFVIDVIVNFRFSTKYLLKLFSPLYLASIASFLYSLFDQLTLIPLVSVTALGLYGAAVTAFAAYNELKNVLGSVLLPVFSGVHGVKGPEGLNDSSAAIPGLAILSWVFWRWAEFKTFHSGWALAGGMLMLLASQAFIMGTISLLLKRSEIRIEKLVRSGEQGDSTTLEPFERSTAE